MKKVFKFFLGAASVAALAAGAYYVYKNYIEKKDDDSDDDFDEFEDDFENTDKNDSREYVSINIVSEEPTEEAASESEETAEAEEAPAASENE